MKPAHVTGLFRIGLLIMAGWAAVDAFGQLQGLGALAALWLLMPEQQL